MRITELKNRPEALENLRRSLNLTVTFLKQVAGMKEKDEIYTNKDLEDSWKVLNETVVSILSILSVKAKYMQNL